MAFTHNSSTDEGLLRTLINDTDSTDYVFEDDELTNILSLNSDDVWKAAADCCRSLAAKYSKEIEKISLGKGDVSIQRKKAAYYRALAQDYEKRGDGDVVEYIDSYNISINNTGIDESEYIGDDT